MRMLSYPDLLASNAKYHRSFYSHYISQCSITAACHPEKSGATTIHDQAFNELKIYLDQTVFSKSKGVTTLAALRLQFIQYLLDLGACGAEQYTSWKLKERLTKHYGYQLVCITLNGCTDIVCSSSVTLGDALKKISSVKNVADEHQP